MKSLKIGTAILLGAGFGAVACHSEKEPTMQPAARSQPPPAPTYATPEMGAPEQQPPMGEAPSGEAMGGEDTSGGSSWGTGSHGSATMSPDAQAAADKIVATRCEREATCNNIGSGRKYQTREACNLALNAEMSEALNSANCPGGIDATQVVACVAELRKESCTSGLSAVEHVTGCRAAAICSD